MKIGYWAATVGPYNMLRIIGEAGQLRGHEVVSAPRESAPDPEIFTDCDVFIMCPSSREIGAEIALIKAHPETPLVVVEDVPGAMSRKAFVESGCADGAFVFLAMPQSQWKNEAFALGYFDVGYVGPPPHWGPSYQQMVAEYNMRPLLQKRYRSSSNLSPLRPLDEVDFYSGTKDSVVVNRVLAGMKSAGTSKWGDHFVLGFKEHPGEKPHRSMKGYEKAEAAYQSAIEEREQILSDVWNLDFTQLTEDCLSRGGSLLSALLKSADIPILTASGATESIVAAYARLHVFLYTDDDVSRGLRDNVYADGRWFVSELGGALVINGPNGFKDAFDTFHSSSVWQERLKALQHSWEKNFPLPKTWDTAPLITKKIEDALMFS